MMTERPICETPGCGRTIPKGGEGHPETCPTCLACLRLHGPRTLAPYETREVIDNLDSARLAVKWVVDHEHRAHEYDRPYTVSALEHIETALQLLRPADLS